MRSTDYTTYAGDRHTKLTPAQRERKVNAARAKILEAHDLLKEVCADFDSNGYRLTVAERTEWREAVDMIVPLQGLVR